MSGFPTIKTARQLVDEGVVMCLTPRQRQMLLDSGPDDITGEEGCGVELLTGADYAVAKALRRQGFGHLTGPGGELPGMYWSGAEGLRIRAVILSAGHG